MQLNKILLIFIFLLCNKFLIIDCQQEKNHSQEAKQFVESANLSESDKSILAKSFEDLINSFKELGANIKKTTDRLENKAALDQLSKKLEPTFAQLKEPLTKLFMQIGTYIAELKSKKQKNENVPLPHPTK